MAQRRFAQIKWIVPLVMTSRAAYTTDDERYRA